VLLRSGPMAHALLNGQKIYYEDTGGDGPPIVLAHGFLMDHTMFVAQVAALRDQFRVVTWDERGFGLTEFDGAPFTYWDSAADCLALMTHLGIERAVVGGMSQGGFISLRVALSAPDRVRALVLLDTQAGLEHPDVVGAYQGLMDAWYTSGLSDEIGEIVAGIIITDPAYNSAWIAKWKAIPRELIALPGACLLQRDDLTARLGEITCAALVVHGSADAAISLDRAEELAGGLVGCGGVVTVEGAHAANMTNSEPVNAAILEFLADLPA